MKTDLLCSSCPRLTTLPFVFMALHLEKVGKIILSLCCLTIRHFVSQQQLRWARCGKCVTFTHHCLTQLTWLIKSICSIIAPKNLCSVDSTIGFPDTNLLDSDLSGRVRYPTFEQVRPDLCISWPVIQNCKNGPKRKSSLFIADYNRFLFALQIVHDHGLLACSSLCWKKTVNFLARSYL